MATYISNKEKKLYPKMSDMDPSSPEPSGTLLSMGRVEIDNDTCNGCKLCVEVCPANSLMMTGKTSVAMKGENPTCIACGDCVPICLPKVIKITRFQDYKGRYKHLGRNETCAPRQF